MVYLELYLDKLRHASHQPSSPQPARPQMACSFQALGPMDCYRQSEWIAILDRQRYILAGVTFISGFEAMLRLVYLWHLVRNRGSSKAMKTDSVRPVTTHTAVIGLMVAVAHYTKMWMYSKFVP